jgi:DNA-binding NarL/FixJ family response regulator
VTFRDSNQIRVLLADDHSIVLDGLRRIIDDTDDLEVVAEASSGEEALKQAGEKVPDVAVIDISMPGYDGLEVLSHLQTMFPDMAVIILTMHEEEQYMFRSVEAGAMGYITKRSAPDQLVTAIRKVYSGKRYFPEEVVQAMAVRLAQGGAGESPVDLLSMRELQVLRGIAQGYTNKEIAATYHLSVKTVDTYRSRLLKKLNLRNNADLSRFAYQNNLIE